MSFFLALILEHFCSHRELILECPYKNIERAKIDTTLTKKDSDECYALEFKYNRENPRNNPQPRPYNAGRVFNDIFRLAKVPRKTAKYKYFIYVTDYEMANYYNNQKHSHKLRIFEVLN